MRMEIFILENIRMENQKEKDNILGKTDHSTLENLEMVLSMEKEDGKVVKDHKVINMKVIIVKIKSKALVYLLGQAEIFIKVNIKRMKEMVTEK